MVDFLHLLLKVCDVFVVVVVFDSKQWIVDVFSVNAVGVDAVVGVVVDHLPTIPPALVAHLMGEILSVRLSVEP